MSIFANKDNYYYSLDSNGFMFPQWLKPGKSLPHDVPQPIKTFRDTLSIKHRGTNIPALYILTVDKGADASKDEFASQASRADEKGWKVLHLQADHNPQWSAPGEFANMLYENR